MNMFLHGIHSTYIVWVDTLNNPKLLENDYNLNIPRYVDIFEEEAAIDLSAVQQEIDTLEAQLATVRTEMRGHLKNLGLATK